MDFAQDSRLIRSQTSRTAAAGDALVLLNLDRGTYFTLNATGAWVWEKIDGHRALDEICSGLAEHFDVDRATAWRDLLDLVRDLQTEGLVAVAGTD